MTSTPRGLPPGLEEVAVFLDDLTNSVTRISGSEQRLEKQEKEPMAISTIAGYSRIGRDRELKWATERYWAGWIDALQQDRDVLHLHS